MSFTQPEFYWKETLLGILCELLLCHLIWFDFFFQEGEACEAFFFFSSVSFRNIHCKKHTHTQNRWTSFFFPENLEGIVMGNLTVHMLFFQSLLFHRRLFLGITVQMHLRVPRKIMHGLFLHQLCWLQCLTIPNYKLLKRSLSSDHHEYI